MPLVTALLLTVLSALPYAQAGESAGTAVTLGAGQTSQADKKPDGATFGEATASSREADLSAKQIWSMLEASDWITVGAADAPRVAYVFSDPSCIYCYRFWKRARPWVSAGAVQMRYLLVDLLGLSSTGMAATIMMADDPAAALTRHEQQFENGGIERAFAVPDKVRDQLDHNRALLRKLGFGNIVPGIVVRDEQGRVQRWPGLPAAADMEAVLGRLPEG